MHLWCHFTCFEVKIAVSLKRVHPDLVDSFKDMPRPSSVINQAAIELFGSSDSEDSDSEPVGLILGPRATGRFCFGEPIFQWKSEDPLSSILACEEVVKVPEEEVQVGCKCSVCHLGVFDTTFDCAWKNPNPECCGAIFHRNCILTVINLTLSNTCPNYRSPIWLDQQGTTVPDYPQPEFGLIYSELQWLKFALRKSQTSAVFKFDPEFCKDLKSTLLALKHFRLVKDTPWPLENLKSYQYYYYLDCVGYFDDPNFKVPKEKKKRKRKFF